jgi:methyl-accepting chemotaxis protein
MMWQKLAIFGLLGIALLMAPLAVFLVQSTKEIGVARTEKAGLAPARTLLQVIQLTQQHRGLSANVLGGNTQMQAQRTAKQVEVEQAIGAFAATVKGEDNTRLASAVTSATESWKVLAQGVAARTIAGSESNSRHTSLIAGQLVILQEILSHYGLALDPDANGYYLMMALLAHQPNMIEVIGQARARGSLHLAQQTISPEDRTALSVVITLVDLHYRNMTLDVGRAIESNPALKATLGSMAQESAALAQKAVQLARQEVVGAQTLTYSGLEYYKLFTQVIDAQFKLNASGLEEFEKILDRRIGELRTGQFSLLGVIALVALISVWLGFAVARSILGQLGGEPAYAAEVVGKVASGDLTVQIDTKANDQSSLLYAMKAMVQTLSHTVRGVKESTDTISTASKEIAQGNADLSQRTEEQASSLEETASSMEELTSTVKQNAENARQANQLALGASAVAVKGGEVVGQVVQTMSSINESSRKIVDIISVIDGIAFQTNILALNAAVEAARAGEQGRGFAVVATEVRNLAQRSAAAAKEIKALIGDSVDKVGAGTKLVDEAGKTMQEIVSSVKRVTDIMGEITAASQEQSAGIEQVNQAITQMDEVTQQNSALVEQAAAAAESMQEQAQNLMQSVSVFKLADGQVATSRPA